MASDVDVGFAIEEGQKDRWGHEEEHNDTMLNLRIVPFLIDPWETHKEVDQLES
jgi:hypothetical protein